MAQRSRSKSRPEEATRETPRSRHASGSRRWLLVGTAILALGVAAVVVERLTRPVETPPSPTPDLAEAERRSAPMPLDAAAAAEEAVAAGKRIADQLATVFPDDAESLTVAGQLHFALGQSGKAVAGWEKSVALNPQAAEAWSGLATAQWERGAYEQAVACMARVRDADPRLADERVFVLADSLMNLGREREAIALLEPRGRDGNLAPAGLLVLGLAYLQAEEYENARRPLAAALAADPRLTKAHYALAAALAGLGQAEEARRHREEYARLKAADQARFDQLRGVGREIEKVNPDEVRGVVSALAVRAGKLYAGRGRFAEAEAAWQTAARLNPRNPEPQQFLESLRAQGK